MDLPLELILKNKDYLEIARLQDEVVSKLYNINTKLTFHGGTSVWRCYGGKRFSFDLDMYVKSSSEISKLIDNLAGYGLNVKNSKLRGGERSIYYYAVSNGKASITLEFAQKKVTDRVIATYIKTDGSGMDIFSLSPESLIKEKVTAYLSRRAIKDLYDIFVLAHVSDSDKTKSEIYKLISNIKYPVDEKTLPQFIYYGPIPEYNSIIDYLKRRYEIH